MSADETILSEAGVIWTQAEIEKLVARFESGTLPKSEWTHHAHLLVGLWYVFHHGKDNAAPLMREGVKHYNTAVGTANTETSGYHETITLFFLWYLDRFLQQTDRLRPLSEIAGELLVHYSNKNLPLVYYSKERLMSVEARFDWIEPDLKPLN